MARQPSPRGGRLAGIDYPVAAGRAAAGRLGDAGVTWPVKLSPVLMVLFTVLLFIVCLKLTGTHLAAGHRLGILIGPSPLWPLSAAQLGKVAAFCGIALLCGGAILLALHWPHDRADRRLARRFLWLLGAGALLVVALDLGPAMAPSQAFALAVQVAEWLVKWAVLGGCAVLLAHRTLNGCLAQAAHRRTNVPSAAVVAGASFRSARLAGR